MLAKTPRTIENGSGSREAFESRQPRRLVLALVLLLVAFAGVLYRDQDFWFGPRTVSSLESDAAEPQGARKPVAKSVPSADKPAVAPAPATKKQNTAVAKPAP